MSTPTRGKRLSTATIRARKGGTPLVCLTAYTTPMARRLDPHVDLLLVGDSLGMVLYGFPSTLPVTLEMMITHGAAVVRGSEHACVIIDLPFGSYQESPEQAFRNAARAMAETGAGGVKLEGGEEMADTIRFLVRRGIPVCGHVGLMPQQDHRGVKGRTRCMRGFKSFTAAARFCGSHDGLRNFLRLRTRHNQHIPASRRRLLHLRRATIALAILEAA